jgi:hypothetical protein
MLLYGNTLAFPGALRVAAVTAPIHGCKKGYMNANSLFLLILCLLPVPGIVGMLWALSKNGPRHRL